jgi:hypothetical protein
MSDYHISKALDITPKIPEEKKQELVLIDTFDEEKNHEDIDYNLTRQTLTSLIKKGTEVVEDINTLAKHSEQPRAYEVLATLLKTVAETSKDLYDLQKKKKEMSATKIESDGKQTYIDKAVFVGTTADLLSQIRKK